MYSKNHVAVSLSFLETKLINPSSSPKTTISRRNVIQHSFLSSSSLVLLITQHPRPVHAVAPITSKEAETGIAKAKRVLVRRNPPKILRQKMNLDFAVLLMRTSYSIVDELDIIPMNQFQRDFFLIRTAEYEPYIQSLGPGYVKQGDLTDPSYFDFIALAQYLTINRVLNDPATVFEELQPIPDEESTNDKNDTTPSNNPNYRNDGTASAVQRFAPVIVRRTITNDQLLPTFQKKLGATILQYFEDTYKDTPIAVTIPKRNNNNQNQPPSVDAIQASLIQIVKLFLINGFAWDGRVEVVPSKTTNNPSSLNGVTFVLTLDSPASLWGNESLHRQRSTLTNDYLLYVVREFIQERMGCAVAASYVKFQDNAEITYIQL